MSKSTAVFMIAICLTAAATAAAAADFDGSKPLSGVTGKIVEINAFKVIDGVDPDTVGLPRKFLIDFDTRTLSPSKDSMIRKTITFNSLMHVENKLVMQGVDEGVEGVEDALAWSLTISKKDGKAVLSASGAGKAYVVFGVCTPVGDN